MQTNMTQLNIGRVTPDKRAVTPSANSFSKGSITVYAYMFGPSVKTPIGTSF